MGRVAVSGDHQSTAADTRPLVLVTLAGGGWHRETFRILERWPRSTFRVAYVYGHHSRNHSAARLPMPHDGPRFPIRYLGPTRKRARRWVTNTVRFGLSFLEGFRLMGRLRPQAVLAVGHPAAVPLFLAAKLWRAHTVFVESLTRVHDLSLTGRIIYRLRLAHRVYVQWPGLCGRYGRCRYAGSVL